jgi:hypothetical protein
VYISIFLKVGGGAKEGSVPIRAHDKHILIHSQVFSVSAAYVCADGAGRLVCEERFYYRPWLYFTPRELAFVGGITREGGGGWKKGNAHLIPRARKMPRNLLIHFMHMLFLIRSALYLRVRHLLPFFFLPVIFLRSWGYVVAHNSVTF